jgi:hypothetical protein
LATILLNPATARVSLQYLHIQSRITHETMPILPKEVNAISLATPNLKQNFHHVCKETSGKVEFRHSPSENGSRDFKFIDCCKWDFIFVVKLIIFSESIWLHELRKRLLLPPTPETLRKKNEETQPGKILGHRRTVSDIPQFDEDTDSLSCDSLDSLEHEVLDVLQCIIDTVVEEEEGGLDNTMFMDASEDLEDGKETQTVTLEEQAEEPTSEPDPRNSGEAILETIVEEKGVEQPRPAPIAFRLVWTLEIY